MKRGVHLGVAGVLGAVVLLLSAAAGSAAAGSAAAGSAGAAGSAVATRSPSAGWPQYGGSASRQFYQPDETVLGRGNAAKLKMIFFTAEGVNSAAPVLAGGVLYESSCTFDDQTGLFKCRIAAQNASTGAIVWNHRVPGESGGPDLAPVAVDGGRVFEPFLGSKIKAVDAATGQSVLWTVHLPLAAEPAVAGGTVFAGGSTGTLYAFSESTGARLWAVQLGQSISQPPAVAGGIVYAGSGDGVLHALNAATGAQLWSAKVEGALTAYPSAGDGMVFAAASNGSFNTTFYAFDAKSGALRWKFAGGSKSLLQWAAVDAGNVYVVDNVPGTVHAFAARTGHKLWTATPQSAGPGGVYEPVVANGVIYVGTDYAINAYNTATGASLANISLDTLGADCAFPQYSDGLAVANAVLYSDCEAWALPKPDISSVTHRQARGLS